MRPHADSSRPVRLAVMPIEDRDPRLAHRRDGRETDRGWRRVGCLAALVGSAVAILSTVVAVLLLGPDEDAARVDEPCDLLEIQLAYLEGATVGESEPAEDVLTDEQLATEIARVRRGLADRDC